MTRETVKITEFDSAKYLRDDEDIAHYLAASLELDDMDVFLAALSTAARAKGMTQLAKETGLGRASLYKTLAPGATPRFDTIMKITEALGLSWDIKPKQQ